MKKLISLLLAMALLLGMAGTVTAAAAEAEALQIPELKATVDATGKVSVSIGKANKDVSNAQAYVYPSDGSGSIWVDLRYDSAADAWIGEDEEVAGGTFSSVYFSKYETKWADDDKSYDSHQVSYDYSFNSNTGKLTYSSVNVSDRKDIQIEIPIINSDGEEVISHTWITVSENGERINNQYYYETGELSYTEDNVYEKTGDEKGYTKNSTVNKTDYTTYTENGKKIVQKTESSGTETEKYKGFVSEYGYINYHPEYDERVTQDEYYRNDEYTGFGITRSKSTYDPESENYWDQTGYSYESVSYNKDRQLTGIDTHTTITAGDTRTETDEYRSTSYDKDGRKSGSSVQTYSYLYKKVEDDNYSYWDETSYESHRKEYSSEGAVIYTYDYSRNQDDAYSSNEAYYTNEGKKTRSYERKSTADSYSYTRREYDAYTGALTYEYSYTDKPDEDGNWKSSYSYTYNNDNGSLRRKYMDQADGSRVYYNQDGKLVAKRDKDGTWTDGSGKLIGKNTDTQTTYVSFKSRTGEIADWEVDLTETDSDGVTTYTNTYYDADGNVTSQSRHIQKANGDEEQYQDDRLEWKSVGNTTTWYDAKGNVSQTEKYNPDTKVTSHYDAWGVLSYEYDNEGNWKYYDDDGKVIREEKAFSDEKSYGTAYYGAEGKLLYTRKVVNATEDAGEYTVYLDKNGKEFARTYSKSESKTDEETGITTSTSESQRIYSENSYYYDDDDYYYDYYYWNPEDASGRMEKSVSTQTYGRDEDGVYTSSNRTDYTRWDLENGEQTNVVTRSTQSEYRSEDDKYEQKQYTDGVLTSEYAGGTTNSGRNETTYKYYDAYTGEMTSMSKNFSSGKEDDPISYNVNYDQYGNLETYTRRDSTDDWNWSETYYANGSPEGEYWYDGLDGDSEYRQYYYVNGNTAYSYTRNDDDYTRVNYNEDGSYRSWVEYKDGVTNTWNYDSKGNFTGYRWNEIDTDSGYSYEMWDAEKLLYTYETEWLATGTVTTYTDPEGNTLIYKDGDYTLTLATPGDGWRYAVGSWFYLENGEPVKDEWRELGGSWYFFNWTGRMATSLKSENGGETVYALGKDGVLGTGGWIEISDGVYAYTDENGEVLTGWQEIDGKWYYFTDGWSFNKTTYKADASWTQSTSRGRMVTGTARIWNSDWSRQHTYFFNEDGTWDTAPGWKTTNGYNYSFETHYYDQNGNEVTGWQQIDGKWYYFNEDGVLMNGWVGSGSAWYYMDPVSGTMTIGWLQEKYDEDWYYTDENGLMQTGWQQIDGVWYYFNDSGIMAANDWADGVYYMKADGTMATGWTQDTKGSWYCLGDDGVVKTGWLQSGSAWYYMGTEGRMRTGWQQIDGGWYYFGDDGVMQTGWIKIGSFDYYLNADGTLVTGQATIDGKVYNFSETGALLE